MAGAALALPHAAKAQGFCFYGDYGTLLCVGSNGGSTETMGPVNPPRGSTNRGDPVDVASGNVFLHITDYTTAGQNPLQLIRYYNSMAEQVSATATTFAASFGSYTAASPVKFAVTPPPMNWRTNYERYLQISPSVSPTSVIAERAEGQQITFTLSGSTWTPPTDQDYTLTHSGSTWTLTDHDDTVEVYSDAGTGQGLLSTITLRNGYTQTMSYTAVTGCAGGTVLCSVTDSYSRSLNFTYTGAYLTSVSTPDSLVVSYGYTSYGNLGFYTGNAGYILTSVSYNTSPATSQTYAYATTSEWPYQITSITDENGNTSVGWSYNGAGQANWSRQGGGTNANYTSFSYSGSTTTTVTNANGVNDTYTFAISQGVPKLSEIDRASTANTAAAHEYFTYDGNGFLNDVKDWNGNETTITNDAHGDPTSVTEAYGSAVARTTTIAYDATWVHEPDTITTTGDTITFTYDGSGNPLTRTDTDTTSNSTPYSTNGQTRVTTWTWNGTGELTSVQLPRTDLTVKTTFGYTSGVLTSITDPLSNAWSITSYTGGGYPETIVDPNSVTTTLAYGTRLNLNTRTVDPSGGDYVTTYTHDPANNLTAVELPDGATLTYTLDAANRPTNITDLSSHSINYTLDELGNSTATTFQTGASTKLSHSATFDKLGRILTDVGASSQTTTYTYDPNGNVLTIAPPSPSGTTTYTYDALNRVATRVDPSPGGTTTFTYDAHNRLTNVQDANGNSTAYVNDGFGDVTQVTSPDTGVTVYHYDKDRNLTQKVFAGSQTVNFTYDADDRNLTIAYPSDSTLNVSKTYDQTTGHGYGVGHLTSVTDQAGSDSFTYDKRGNRTAESRVITSVGTLSTSYTVDAASRPSTITYPSGTVVSYTRNSMGRVTGVTAKPPGAGSASNIATSITYEPFGPVTGLTFGNGITGTYSYNSDYQPTSRVDTTGTDVMNLAYAYKTNGSLYTITDTVNAANSQTFGYDALDRLTSATSGMGGYGTYGWTWDAVNNVATQVINSVTTTFSLNSGSNQLSQFVTGATTTTVDTTANGNILDLKISGTPTLTNTFNQANQMASAVSSSSASYKYGFDGKRLEKVPSSGYPLVYQYAGSLLLSENDLHSGQTADYIYLNGRPIGEVDPTSGDIYFMHTDRQGTPQYVTDSTPSVVWGAVYNPFGDNPVAGISGSLATQSLRLPGQYFDPESGNNHNGFRNYSGSLTRYAESDPIGLGGGMNTYQYVAGNPSKYTDRWGLDPNSMACQEGSVMCGSGSAGSPTACAEGSVLCNSGPGFSGCAGEPLCDDGPFQPVYNPNLAAAMELAFVTGGASAWLEGLLFGAEEGGGFLFSTDESQLEHLFSDEEGHLADTAENRELLQSVANDPNTTFGPDRYGTVWSARTLDDGTQVWTGTRNGIIRYGGLNNTPQPFNPATGFSSPNAPPIPK